MSNSKTDLIPHQICLVYDVLQGERRRWLIAEEVGMGKTIETGMIIHALIQRRELERCLIICPAGQIIQWQEELKEKLGLEFLVYRVDINGNYAFSFQKVIASLDTVKLASHKDMLLKSGNWDLIVFDEAHRLSAKDYGSKTDKTQNYRLAEELSNRTRDFIFLTGTPHDGNDSKFKNLLTALEPEISFNDNGKGVYYPNIILKNRKSEARGTDGRLLFKPMDVRRVIVEPEGDEARFHKELVSYLKQGYGFANQDPQNYKNRAIGFVMTTFQKLASSSTAAVKQALSKRLGVLNDQIQAKNSDNNEKIEDDRYAGENEEKKIEEVSEVFAQIEIDMISRLVNHPPFRDAKIGELIILIDKVLKQDPEEKFIIFTEYRGTLAFLESEFSSRHGEGCCTKIIGGMGVLLKDQAIEDFRENPEIKFMLSTEAGGEGINLQFCHLVINYDLPWNPFRLVQRYGRVHRIGQKHNSIQVFNFKLKNPLEEKIDDCHEQKMDSAIKRLSEKTGEKEIDIRDQLVGLAQEFIDYEKIYKNSLIQSETESSEKEIEAGILRAEEAYILAYEEVFRRSVSPFNPDRFKKIFDQTLDLNDLQKWVDGYLKQQGRMMMYRPQTDTYEFLVPKSLTTKNREKSVNGTFDRGRAIKDDSVRLLAFGDPMIELFLRHTLSFSSTSKGLTGVAQLDASHDKGLLATVLIRKEAHSGPSAFSLSKIFWSENTKSCSFFEEKPLTFLEKTDGSSATDYSSVKNDMIDFLQEQLPDVEFIEDQIFWVCLCRVI
ncbi:helicase-related protein [Desulfococcaceae bacterium HSG8]|nr:helicase-related protein [Desulfococcaceae bacterium HSG8]